MSWESDFNKLYTQTEARLDRGTGNRADLFPAEYRSRFTPELAVRDALHLSDAIACGNDVVDLWEPHPSLDNDGHRLQFYGASDRSLDEWIPLLRNLGVRVIDQVQFEIEAGGHSVVLRSFKVSPATPGSDLSQHKQALLDALTALLANRIEDDSLNALVIIAGLSWREVDLLRAYRNYYFQLGSRFGTIRFHRALLSNPRVAVLLSRYFAACFQPDDGITSSTQRDEESIPPIRQELLERLNQIADVSEDHILRDLFNLIDATVRTDFYQARSDGDWSIALKISSLGVFNMPAPRPLFEIFVHSSLMDGIHLRGAKVARGGIRWSDRPDDFRTEILDLMQTQMIKNALIVPQGAKGGFIVKQTGADPSERASLGIRAYQTLIRGLLNLTDNRQPSGQLLPAPLVAHDEPDPYLVVAADKGTARFSDIANQLAIEHGFWLGDAFASGGSRGYHHKGLGITARGAFECIKRHFLELGQDLEKSPFTVIGVGSMDGDVFGNGMLLSENILLRGAIAAEHIFLDPMPDARTAFAERRRLFELPSSSWDQYDRSLISPGGGVFRRAAREIQLSPAVREWLGVRHTVVEGEELVRLLLAAPVDLLWLGGIGTYVKASSERHEDVADRGNDSVRIDAGSLRAKIVGEGANLGFTQKARIEYALAGGRINTDAVDNSAGVDLSDHEVNLKILMAHLLELGLIADSAERDRLLTELTPSIVATVLSHNRCQSLCLSLDRERCLRDVEPFLELADRLVNADLLDREVEAFPSRKEVGSRVKAELTRPELAVLMAYAKLALKRTLLADRQQLTDAWSAPWLAGYFPESLQQRFKLQFAKHPLAPELTATCLSNILVDQAGVTCLEWLDDWTPEQMFRAVTAYLFFDGILDGAALRDAVLVTSSAPSARQYALLLRLEETLAACSRWALREGWNLTPNGPDADEWRRHLSIYLSLLPTTVPAEDRTTMDGEAAEWIAFGLAPGLARLAAALDRLEVAEMVSAATVTQTDIEVVVKVTEAVAERLGIARILALLDRCQPRDRWERRARLALRERFRAIAPRLARSLLRAGQRDPEIIFASPQLGYSLARVLRMQKELTAVAGVSLAPFAALVAELGWVREMAESHLAKVTSGNHEPS